MKGVLRFVKGLFATCKEVGDVVLVDRLQFFRYTHFKKNQCWYSFFILLVIISASVAPCLADGGIGYKGIYINAKGTKTWYKAHDVTWSYNGCSNYQFNSATSFSGLNLGTFSGTDLLQISGFAVIGWGTNGDWVSGRLSYKIWLQGDLEPATWNDINIGNYGNYSGPAQEVCTSGNDRVVGFDNGTININPTNAGNYNFKIQALGRMQYSGSGGGFFNTNDGPAMTATFTIVPSPLISSAISSHPTSSTSQTYKGATITVNGTNLGSVTTIKLGGASGTIITPSSQTATQISFTVPDATSSGTVYVSDGTSNATSSESFVNLGYISNAAIGNYSNTSSWLGNAAPVNGSAVTIANGHTITLDAATTITTLTINTGGIFSNGNQTLNISAGGTLTNNGTFTGGTGTVNFVGAGTVNGSNAITFNNLTINTGSLTFSTIPIIDGIFTINDGNVNQSPIYSANSTLYYNKPSGYNRYLEWNAVGVGTIGTTQGYPNHVTINTGSFDLVNGSNSARAMAGSLTVNNGASFNINTLNAPVTVGGSMTLNGNGSLSMGATNAALTVSGSINMNGSGSFSLSSSSGGDLNLGGDFTKTNGTFNCNNRQLGFIGTGTQTFFSNATEVINYLLNSKASGTLNLNSSISIPNTGNNVTFNANTATVIGPLATITMASGTTLNANNIGSTITVNGKINNAGTVNGVSDPTIGLRFGSSGVYEHNFATTNGTIPTATWVAGSTCSIIGFTSNSTTPAGLAQSFSNFVWNCPNQTANPSLSGNPTTITGNFSIQSTGTGSVGFAASTSPVMNVSGNMTVSGGTFNISTGSGSPVIRVGGSFQLSGGTISETSSGVGVIEFNGSSTQAVQISGGSITNAISFRCNNINGISITGTLPINSGATFYRTRGTISGSMVYNASNSTLEYDGSTNITTTASEWPLANGPANVIINNSAGVVLHAPRSISGVLTLSSGIITTSTTNTLTLTNSAGGSVSGGSATSYVNGPLDWAVTSGTTYTYPIGAGGAYYPATISAVAGTSPVIRMQAFNGTSGGIADGSSITSISNTEYWQASLSSGTLTSATLGFTRTTPVGSFTGMGRSSTANGNYSNVGGTASGSQVAGVATGSVLGFYVMGATVPLYYWSNAATMNWSTASSWQTTATNSYSSPITASIAPNASNSLGITIRSGHTVSIDATSSLDQTVIQANGTLVKANADLTINDGTGTDLEIQNGGIYRHSTTVGNNPIFNTGSTILVRGGGLVDITSNATGATIYGTSTNITYETNAIFNWNINSPFGASGQTFFPNAGAEVVPIFRLSTPISLGVGGGLPTVINGVFEANGNVSWDGNAAKTFRNGIIGIATITQSADCGQFRITGTTSQLGSSVGTLTLNLRNELTSGLALQAGSCTLLGSVTSNSGPMYIDAGATLIAGAFSIGGTGSFTLNNNATLVTAHPNGVNGSITLSSGNINLVEGANYTFNGTVAQTTGDLMRSVIGTLTINNTGTAPNNTVILSKDGHRATNLFLQNGRFGTGIGQKLQMGDGSQSSSNISTVEGKPYNGRNGEFILGANGGTLVGTGWCYINGDFNLWNVEAFNNLTPNGIKFQNGNATINNYLKFLTQGFVGDAPKYAPNSVLIYSNGGTYNRNVEWGNAPGPGNPGYPWHVVVEGNTTLNLGDNPIAGSADRLELAGNLTVGTTFGPGNINMGDIRANKPNPAPLPLSIKGNLEIGKENSTGSNLTLGPTVGNDLWLFGDFNRFSGSFYTDNNRAIFFKGSGNSEINVLPTPPAASLSNPTQQDFSYAYIDKSVETAQITPNCGIGITQQIGFITGILNTAMDRLLVIKRTDPVGVIADANTPWSYVNGPIRRYLSTTPGTYVMPVGKKDWGRYKPVEIVTVANINANDYFEAEYFYGNNVTPEINADIFSGSILGILKDEYWQVDRGNTASGTGTTTAKVALPYVNPGNGYWRLPDGTTGINPCFNCNVAVVKRNNSSGDGVWDFTSVSGVFASSPANLPEYRWYQNDGRITSGVVSTFSPFTIGFSYNVVLGNSQPARLLEFSGTLHNGDGLLSWTMDRTGETVEFVLQHSLDGIHFETISNKSVVGLKYNHIHPQLAPGRHFYRLLVRERNGSSYYSRLVELVVDNAPTHITGLQSTVVNQYLTALLWSSTNQVVKATIYDRAGKLISQQQSHLLPGNNNLRIPVALLATGLYYVEIMTADGVRKTLRWLKE